MTAALSQKDLDKYKVEFENPENTDEDLSTEQKDLADLMPKLYGGKRRRRRKSRKSRKSRRKSRKTKRKRRKSRKTKRKRRKSRK